MRDIRKNTCPICGDKQTHLGGCFCGIIDPASVKAENHLALRAEEWNCTKTEALKKILQISEDKHAKLKIVGLI